MKQISITPTDLQVTNDMLFSMTCLRRWSEVTVEGGKYTELAKQGLNCAIAYIWAHEAIHLGCTIDLTRYPSIALHRAFTKVHQCDMQETNLERIFELGEGISKNSFDEMIQQEISSSTSEGFQSILEFDPTSMEARIYRAATKIGTLIELEEIKNGISKNDFNIKKAQLQDTILEFSDLPGFSQMLSENYLEIFRAISQLRNRIRWAKHPNIIKCSVLGHHFDVAVFAYLMSLEKNPSDEDLATRYFFMGIFHDFPERWTGDMPSPVKNALEGLRAATEKFENEVMEKNVYSILPNYQVEALRKVMLEDEENEQFKVFLKPSDNFSAFVECWREIDAGSNHSYYYKVAQNSYATKEELSVNFRLLMEELYYKVAYHR